MNTLSPLESQEKSVAASAAARTADFIVCSEGLRPTPARKTRVGRPGFGGEPPLVFWGIPRLLLDWEMNRAEVVPTNLRNSLRFKNFSRYIEAFCE